MPQIIDRHLQPRLSDALDAFRVVVLHGARQSGKTTLAGLTVRERHGTYASLDDESVRSAALADPYTFLTTQRTPLAIDEVQLGGDRLIRAVKQIVDQDPTPGRFLLTGSTNFLTVPGISESLAGRARILRLGPFSQAELNGVPSPIATWFDAIPFTTTTPPIQRSDYLAMICRGGYPEVVRLGEHSRDGWFESYVETIAQRDIAALADIRKAAALPQLLSWVAGMTSNELSIANASRSLGITRATISSYLEWLEAVFLVYEVPAWTRNLAGRAVKRPKLHLSDTGLASSLLGASADTLMPATAAATGPLTESFVVNEIRRQLASASAPINVSHFRDNNGREIDLILERRDGATIAIEIKATSSPSTGHLKHVKWFRDKLDISNPGAFSAGVLLHTGDQTLTVGDRIHMLPISALWNDAPC